MIRALEEETLKLAKERDEQFVRDPNIDLFYGGKTTKLPSVNTKLWQEGKIKKQRKIIRLYKSKLIKSKLKTQLF